MSTSSKQTTIAGSYPAVDRQIARLCIVVHDVYWGRLQRGADGGGGLSTFVQTYITLCGDLPLLMLNLSYYFLREALRLVVLYIEWLTEA